MRRTAREPRVRRDERPDCQPDDGPDHGDPDDEPGWDTDGSAHRLTECQPYSKPDKRAHHCTAHAVADVHQCPAV